MDSVLAIMVIYKTKLEDCNTLTSLTDSLKQAGIKLSLIIYDNSPTPLSLADPYPEWSSIEYYHDPTNPGVSKAYNYGLQVAKQQQKNWLLLLDQDTVFPLSAISEYRKFIQTTDSMNLAAPILMANNKIISPFKTGLGKGKILAKAPKGLQNLNEIMPMNSGMLVSVQAMEQCGGYNEEFGVDYSDFAFIKRYKARDERFFVADFTCTHDFSGFDSTDKKESIQRFKSYCTATIRYKNRVEPNMNAVKIILLRALRLTVNYRSLNFLAISFKTILMK